MYRKCYQGKRIGENLYEMHLWESDGEHQMIPYLNEAYQLCDEDQSTHQGLNGEHVRKIKKWKYSRNEKYSHQNTPNLYFNDMGLVQKFLVERYGTNDEPSTGHRELYFDIECEIGGALTEEYIQTAPMTITSIAWWDKSKDHWSILILDKKGQLSHTKTGESKNKEIIPVRTEQELLMKFIEAFREINPDILIGYNSDYFDIPYLYYRICNVLGSDVANYLSPLNGEVQEPIKSKKFSKYFYGMDQYVKIAGIESLDYMRLHRKYSWKDEPSWRLDAIGEKYVGMNKIEYEGNLDQLFETDIHKFIQYNFRDVEILKLLDEKLDYIALTKNISHKGNHNYEEVYYNSITQDGAISAYLLSQNIIPPNREKHPRKKEGYAGGWLFCPKAGLYKNMFDLDLTSLYPSIIMTLNIGKETLVARIIDADDRNNRLGLNDLKEMEPESQLLIHNMITNTQEMRPVVKVIKSIEDYNLTVSANGCMFRTDKESTLSTILNKWFKQRVEFKGLMKKAYKDGDEGKVAHYHLMQYTMKILLNSLYGATALPTFRYGMNYAIISEAITLSGHRIIQESALCGNRFLNKVLKGKETIDL
mgnify:CR=1 FL=1|tara:strand:+ start:3967 stop:5736 length:1770 start_codon:yes stop_codon:yes gene_type:complete